MNNVEPNFNFSLNVDFYPLYKGPVRKYSLNEILPPLINVSLEVKDFPIFIRLLMFLNFSQEVPIQPPGLRLLVMGVLPSVAAPITALRMCPAITTRNWQQYSPLLAGGTTGGLIQVYNIASGSIEKELIVHSYTVR